MFITLIVTLIITLIIVGVLLYLVNAFLPMDPKFKQLVNVLVIIAAILYVLTTLTGYHFPGLHT